MNSKLAEIAEFLGASLPDTAHDLLIEGVASLDEAGPTDISFFGNARYLPKLKSTRAGAVLVPPQVPDEASSAVLLRVENPSMAFAILVDRHFPEPATPVPGIHPTAVVAASAQIADSVTIGPGVVIEDGVTLGAGSVVDANVFIGANSRLGQGCRFYPNVVIRENSVIGSRVIIHAGAVVGADGFGFELVNGRHQKIPQRGFVQIDDDVEIGANTTIDRARFGRTWIQEGCKIDNLVQIAHNVIIGKHSLIVAQVGISGSTRLGQYVTLAGQSGVVGHVEVGDRTILAAQTGLTKSSPAGGVWLGSPAQPMNEAKRSIAHIARLEGLYKRVKELEKRLAALDADTATPTKD